MSEGLELLIYPSQPTEISSEICLAERRATPFFGTMADLGLETIVADRGNLLSTADGEKKKDLPTAASSQKPLKVKITLGPKGAGQVNLVLCRRGTR